MDSKVADIIVDKLLKAIESEKRLPWQKPFISPCMNWFSHREYQGINKFLLDGGEYITKNQIIKYNEQKKTDYWFVAGCKTSIVVFYKKYSKKLTAEELTTIKTKGVPSNLVGKLSTDQDGNLVKNTWTLQYTRVFNITDVKSKSTGECLPSKMGNGVIEVYEEPQKVVDAYCEREGVKALNDGNGSCYYTESDDNVHMTEKQHFSNTEAYYRVLFHELTHSTGIESRLSRQCFKDYSRNKEFRGKEELVAEVGSLLLASECGFRDDSEWVTNSESYIQSWVGWMKDNKTVVVNGMTAADKAVSFILGRNSEGSGVDSEIK